MNILILLLEANAVAGLIVAIVFSVLMKMKSPHHTLKKEVKNGIPRKN